MLIANSVKTLPLLVVLSSACAKVNDRATLSDVLPHQPGSAEPLLGDPYDSLVQEVRNTASCVTGETTRITSNSSEISIDQNTDTERVMKEFTGEVRGTPRVFFLDTGSALGYYRSLNRNKTAINIVYAVKIEQGSERLSRVQLSDDIKALAPAAIFERCGDNYVSQINRGGMLTITVSLQFADETSRNKWETKLKLNGSWADVSKDLLSKIEQGGIESTLSVKVVQVGGSPAQAAAASKTCSLLTQDEFNICKQRIDDLVAYASNGFPQQVETSPAVLQYLTAPLQTLGVRGLPSIPQEVLDVRAELEALSAASQQMKSMMEQAQEVGIPFETSLASAITSNHEKIREAAKACFSYTLDTNTLSWSTCYQQGRGIQSKLAKIDASRSMVHELIVPASSEFGNAIVNTYSVPIDISYAVARGRKWKIEANLEFDAAGLNAQGRGSRIGDAPSPSSNRGALVRSQENRYEVAEQRGTAKIHPGEAVHFMMNDNIDQFANNSGSQTVFWRCTSCTDSMKEVPTHQIRVRANQKGGTTFRSRAGMTGQFRASAYGFWRVAMFGSGNCGPSGTSKTCGSACPAKDEKLGALVLRNSESEEAVLVGSGKVMSIGGTQPVAFMMNDDNYRDNSGAVEVILQCQRCDMSSHEVEIDPNESP